MSVRLLTCACLLERDSIWMWFEKRTIQPLHKSAECAWLCKHTCKMLCTSFCRHCAHQVWSLFIECFGPWVIDARITRVASLESGRACESYAAVYQTYTNRDYQIYNWISFRRWGSSRGALKRARCARRCCFLRERWERCNAIAYRARN